MSNEPLISGRVFALLNALKSVARFTYITLTMSLLARPALGASLSDVQWLAHWLDDGSGSEASQATVEAADPKRFYTGGDDCPLYTEPPSTGEFNPQDSNNSRLCILGKGRGSGQAGDWNSTIRVRITSNGSLCNVNDRLRFGSNNYQIQVPYERCVYDDTTITNISATVYDFPIPPQSPFANGGGITELFLPNIASSRVGYWDFGPPDPIVAFMGGGFVAGTECVDGIVDPEATSRYEEIPVGPDQTFYVKGSGNVYLKRDPGYTFTEGDEVFSCNIGADDQEGCQEGKALVLKSGCYSDPNIGVFAQDGCTNASLPVGSGGSNLLMFRSHTGAEFTLGRMYETTPNVSGGVTESYSCSPPGLLPPDQPTNVVAEAHASGGMFVEFDQDGPGGDPTYYTYQMQDENGTDDRDGTVVDEQGQDDISSPFVIVPEPALTQNPWKVRLKAWNDAGESEWSEYSELITPSVDAPPVPDAPVITGVTTGSGTATVSFTPPDDNGEDITNYAYSLTRAVADPSDFVEFNPAITASPGTLPDDLNNGETYSVSIAAINANGMGPDSNVVEFTPGTQCNDVADWTTPANTMGYFCSVGINDYAYADFHILTTTGTDVCSTPANYLPTGDNNGQGLFCAQEGNTVRAIYDWDNGVAESNARHELTWLASVQQIGSRSLEPSDDACGALGTTVNGRCANQLKIGEDAFRGMAGAGGSAIENLDTSNLDNIEHIFQDASQFNQNISTKQVSVNNVTYIAWDISGVDRINSAFWGATNFNNGGQPLYWDTGSVWNMGWSFAESSFDQNINTQQVTIGNSAFTAWDTSSVQFFDNMFNGATAFDQDVSGWVTTAGINMSSMFYGASSLNQDLSSWNVAAVTNNSNFDEGASAWCGTGFDNRGRPSDWTPSLADGCPAGVDTFVSLEAPSSAVAGDELTYELSYWNSSNAATNGNTLVLTLPTDVTLPADADLSGGTASGGTVTWNNLPVPGGTTPDSGATILVTSIVGSSVASGTNLEAQAGITDDGGNTINDTAIVTVTSQAILQVTLSADPYVLPGEEIMYQVTVENVGKSDTTSTMTLAWDAESGVVPASSTDARCNGTPLACNWSESLRAGERQSRSIKVKMAADTPLKVSVLASASASAANAAESDESAASATTEVAGAPDLNLTLTSLPREMVKPGGTIVYSLVLSNEGNELAKDLFVALPIPAGTVASIPDGAFCDSQASTTTCEASYLSWNLPNLDSDQKAASLTVSVTAPSSQAGLTLQGQYSGKNNVTDETVQGVSNKLSLQIGERPDIELTASFASNEFLPNGQLNLRFNYENVGTAASEPGVLRFNVPTHTVLKGWPQGASCEAAACSDGFSGKVTLPVPSLSENSGARSTDFADFTLQTLPETTSVKVNAALRPDVVGDFLPTAASTDTALLRREPALPVPTLPLAALLTLLGLMGCLGYRRLLAA